MPVFFDQVTDPDYIYILLDWRKLSILNQILEVFDRAVIMMGGE